jgi:hypothetical protein
MKNQGRVLLVVVALAATSLACSLALPGGGPLFQDDFSTSGQWGIGTDADSSIEYAEGGLQMQIFTNNWFIWSIPNSEPYENIHVEVTVKNNGTDPTTAFGILCNQQPVNDLFYYVVITPAGEYAIAETSLTQPDVFLTNDDQFAQSDLIPVEAPSYRIGADCLNGSVTLYVDGNQIASVSDDTFTKGTAGLLTWSGQDVSTANVIFDDFVVTKYEPPQ